MKRIAVVMLCVVALLFSAGTAFAGGELFLYNWSDYTAPDLIKKFEKETGIKVTLDIYDSNETLLAKMKSGGGAYDIYRISAAMAEILWTPSPERVASSHLRHFADTLPERFDRYHDLWQWSVTG